RGRLLATGSRPVTVSVTNADGFPHDFSAVGLDGRKATFGALDWGSFDWRTLAAPVELGPGESRTLTLAPADGTFSLWLGDPDGGDQASASVALDRGPAVDTFSFGPRSAVPGSFAMPAHQAEDAGGGVW